MGENGRKTKHEEREREREREREKFIFSKYDSLPFLNVIPTPSKKM